MDQKGLKTGPLRIQEKAPSLVGGRLSCNRRLKRVFDTGSKGLEAMSEGVLVIGRGLGEGGVGRYPSMEDY